MERQGLVKGGPLLHQGNQRRISNQFVAVDYILKLCTNTPFKHLESKSFLFFFKELIFFIQQRDIKINKSDSKDICMVTVDLYFK